MVQSELTILSEDYTECRQFIDDALHLAGNPVALYDRSNADTRRLANQVFFKKLYINDVRSKRELAHACEDEADVDERSEEHIIEDAVGTPPRPTRRVESKLQYPFDLLTRKDVQEEALAMAGEKGSYSYPPPAGSVAHCFSPTHLGSSMYKSGNLAPKAADLCSCWSNQVSGWQTNGSGGLLTDVRGEVVVLDVQPRTSLSPEHQARLLAEFESGESIRGLARKHKLHRTTVI
ncbi:MAG: hypothetical protein LBJ02_07420, partial [Bifidobacteriaceae bacterium]|nr:hypothetical protein [Bifidobacteriaceae bacterium]